MSITADTRGAGTRKTGGGAAGRRRRGRRLSWIIVTFPALWAVVRLGGLEWGWFLTQLMTFTPYAVVGSGALAVLLGLRRNRPAAVVALAACLALAATVVPRTVRAAAAPGGTPLRVLTINLFARADADAVVRLVREYDPDVLSALEITPEKVAELDAAGLAGLMPHRLLQADEGPKGSGLYAKHPLTPLEGLFTPIGHNMPAATVRLPGGASAQVVAVHPNPPLPGRAAEWNAALAALPPASGDAVRVLAGDFNATLDHRALRDLLDRGYVDAADRAGEGLVPTWPNNRPIPPMITIDHVLVDERVAVDSVRVLDVPRTDHRGVLADLRLP
ncbi:endonuclease/exonuclease/phosphatase family protein [Nonomuraea sp. NPDC047897]|uniref:endonuclease/exonuclease/phosphatase family protein n=1 Tax=Nonomuraea sp. NPDC047897 TaxID=3364346 RepID=UPI0037163807